MPSMHVIMYSNAEHFHKSTCDSTYMCISGQNQLMHEFMAVNKVFIIIILYNLLEGWLLPCYATTPLGIG